MASFLLNQDRVSLSQKLLLHRDAIERRWYENNRELTTKGELTSQEFTSETMARIINRISARLNGRPEVLSTVFDNLKAAILDTLDASGELLNEERNRILSALNSEMLIEAQNRSISVIKEEQADALRKSAELEAIISAVPDPLLIVDSSGRFIRANPATASLTGIDFTGTNRAELIQHFAIREPGKTLTRLEDLPTSRALQGESTTARHMQLTTKKGQLLEVEVSARPIRVENKLYGSISIWHDITERQRLLSLLEKERDIFRTTFDHAPAGMAILTGPDFRYQMVNHAYQALFPGRQLIGKPFGEFREEVSKLSAKYLKEVLDSREPNRLTDVKMPLRRRADGSLQDAYFNSVTIPISFDNHRNSLLIFLMETTEQVLNRIKVETLVTEARRQASEREAIIDQIPAGLIIAESQSGKLIANKQIERIWRRPATDVIRMEQLGQMKGLHPDGRPYKTEEWPLVRSSRKGETVRNEEIIIFRGDGTNGTILSSSTPIRDQNGKVVATALIHTDITERKKTEEQLRLSEAKLNALFTNVPLALCIFDEQLRFQRANPASIRMFNRPFEGIMGRTVENAQPSLAAVLVPRLRKTIKSGEAETNIEFSGTSEGDTSGTVRYWMASFFPIATADGKIRGAGSAIVDITRLKTIESELQKTIQSRDEFLSIASHELKNPLTALALLLQMTSKIAGSELGPAVPQRTKDRLMHMLQNAERQSYGLARLLDRLLDLSRIRAGRLKIEPEEIDLKQLVTDVVDHHRAVAAEKGSTISVVTKHDIRGLWDPTRLEQILTNLISNAIKYGDGRPIIITLDLDGPRSSAIISVTDQGRGISPEMLPRIFHPFERLGQPKTAQGLGLGLFITRQLVEAHGGSIHLHTELGKGSTFTVELPLKLKEARPKVVA